MNQDSVTTNYNTAGTSIMEMIYANDYLSPGGISATESLAELGKISNNQHVLDVGSGLGGAAFYLAEQRRCTVQGIDLMKSNVVSANRRAQDRGLLRRVNFVCADAISLPFEDGKFDVVWGQDAWCHVDDKAKLISECERVLTASGTLVFSDWLLTDPANVANDEIKRITASPNMGNADTYRTLLENQGFDLENYVEPSADFIVRYRDVVKRLHAIETELCEQFGRKVFEIVLSKQEYVLEAFEYGSLVNGCFVAVHRQTP